MRIVRLFGSILSVLGLHLALTGLLVALLFAHFFATPNRFQESMEQAGVYSAITDEAATQIAEQSPNFTSDSGDMSIEDIVRDSLDEAIIQQEVEQALENIYEWLRGETEELAFSLDFSDVREDIAEAIGAAFLSELEALPPCTSPAQVAGATDLQDLDCIPPGIDPEEEADRLVASLLASDNFLPEASLGADELFADNEHIGADSPVPMWFQRLDNALIPMIVAVLLFSAAIVALAKSRRKGIRRVGGHLMSFGAFIAIGFGVAWVFLITSMQIEQLAGIQKALSDALVEFMKTVVLYGAGASLVALLTGVVIRFLIRKPKAH